MREWVLENTDVTAEEYDSLINPETLHIEGESKPCQKETNKIFDHPILAIDLFTQQKPTLFTKIKYRIIDRKQYFIHKNIKFAILADLLEEMKEILYSTNRKGKCFKLSLDILKKCENANIVTLMCTNPNYKEPTPFLHAAILIKEETGNEFILDTTFNIIMKKETYLNLLQAKIISIISREKFQNDSTLRIESNVYKHIYLDEYLCFPEQIMKTAKKLSKTKN